MKAAHIALGLLLTLPWFAGVAFAAPGAPCVLTASAPICAITCEAGVNWTLTVVGPSTHGEVSCPGGPDSHCSAALYCTAQSHGVGTGFCWMVTTISIAVCAGA